MEHGLKHLFLTCALVLAMGSLLAQRDAEGRPMPVAITQKIDTACLVRETPVIADCVFEWRHYCGYDCVGPLQPSLCFTSVVIDETVCFTPVENDSNSYENSGILTDCECNCPFRAKEFCETCNIHHNGCYHWSQFCNHAILSINASLIPGLFVTASDEIEGPLWGCVTHCFGQKALPAFASVNEKKSDTRPVPPQPRKKKKPFNTQTMVAVINTNNEDDE